MAFTTGGFIPPEKDLSKPKISIYLGAIRPYNWLRLYNSIKESVGKYSFELVLCGPISLPENLQSITNIKYIKDYGSPVRGAQIASSFCEGELCALASDDGIYLPGALERAIDFYESHQTHKLVIVTKYSEGGSNWSNDVCFAWYHQPLQLQGVAKHSLVLLSNIMSTLYWRQIGGFDCSLFETTNWGGHDLCQRLINDGATVLLYDKETVLACDWTDINIENDDHMPIVHADDIGYSYSTYQAFRRLYLYPNPERKTIPFDNWREAETIWSTRFMPDGSNRKFNPIQRI